MRGQSKGIRNSRSFFPIRKPEMTQWVEILRTHKKGWASIVPGFHWEVERKAPKPATLAHIVTNKASFLKQVEGKVWYPRLSSDLYTCTMSCMHLHQYKKHTHTHQRHRHIQAHMDIKKKINVFCLERQTAECKLLSIKRTKKIPISIKAPSAHKVLEGLCGSQDAAGHLGSFWELWLSTQHHHPPLEPHHKNKVSVVLKAQPWSVWWRCPLIPTFRDRHIYQTSLVYIMSSRIAMTTQVRPCLKKENSKPSVSGISSHNVWHQVLHMWKPLFLMLTNEVVGTHCHQSCPHAFAPGRWADVEGTPSTAGVT